MGYHGDVEDVTESVPTQRAPRLFDEIRRQLRLKHYGLRTEQAYIGRIRRFIVANGRRHPREVGGVEVEAFLSRLAVEAT